MAISRSKLRETTIAYGRLWLRTQLLLLAVTFFVLGVIFVFIPVDGPFGEISFFSLAGLTFAFYIRSRVPTVKEANVLIRAGNATESVIKRLRGR